MGAVNSIGIDKFPRQGSHLYERVSVCFHYDTKNTIEGIIVRDDIEEPGVEIIRLSDGRYVLSTECQYSLIG
jgi:hypothetical protein